MRKTITALAALTATASALADYAFYGVLDDAVYQESKVTATSTASKILATKQNKMFSAKDNSRFGVKGDKEFKYGHTGLQRVFSHGCEWARRVQAAVVALHQWQLCGVHQLGGLQ
jgi:predicted porin